MKSASRKLIFELHRKGFLLSRCGDLIKITASGNNLTTSLLKRIIRYREDLLELIDEDENKEPQKSICSWKFLIDGKLVSAFSVDSPSAEIMKCEMEKIFGKRIEHLANESGS